MYQFRPATFQVLMCLVSTRLNSRSGVDLELPSLTVWPPQTLFRLPHKVLFCLNALGMPLFVTKDHFGKLTTIKKESSMGRGTSYHLSYCPQGLEQGLVLTI